MDPQFARRSTGRRINAGITGFRRRLRQGPRDFDVPSGNVPAIRESAFNKSSSGFLTDLSNDAAFEDTPSRVGKQTLTDFYDKHSKQPNRGASSLKKASNFLKKTPYGRIADAALDLADLLPHLIFPDQSGEQHVVRGSWKLIRSCSQPPGTGWYQNHNPGFCETAAAGTELATVGSTWRYAEWGYTYDLFGSPRHNTRELYENLNFPSAGTPVPRMQTKTHSVPWDEGFVRPWSMPMAQPIHAPLNAPLKRPLRYASAEPQVAPYPEGRTATNGPPAPPKTPFPGPVHTPPGPGVKERKAQSLGRDHPLEKLVGGATELLDIIDCAYDALPKKRKFRGDGQKTRLAKVFQYAPEMDLKDFVQCLVQNALEDDFIGKLSSGATESFAGSGKFGAKRGITIGPAL